MKAELGTEISDQVIIRTDMFLKALVHALLLVGIIGGQYPLKVLHEDPVIGSCIETLLRDPSQKGFRIMAAASPDVPVKPCEQPPDLAVPAIEKIIGKFLEAF